MTKQTQKNKQNKTDSFKKTQVINIFGDNDNI